MAREAENGELNLPQQGEIKTEKITSLQEKKMALKIRDHRHPSGGPNTSKQEKEA